MRHCVIMHINKKYRESRVDMDLKTYAVYRKLTANSTLLEHLANNTPVPVDVLQQDMQALIASLHNAEAEQLVADYPRYLQEHVQIGSIKDGENQFTIRGEIDEPVIRSIELLHSVEREDVVETFVTKTMMDLNGHREVVISDLSLSESVDSFVEMTKLPLDTQSSDLFGTPTSDLFDTPTSDLFDTPTSGLLDTPTSDLLDTTTSDLLDTPTVEVPTQDFPLDDFNVDDIMQDIPESFDNIPDNVVDTPTSDFKGSDTPSTPEVDLSFMDDELPFSAVELDPPVFESPDDELPISEADNTSDSAAFKSAYDYLVGELKSRGLDKRLPNLHLA